MARPTQKHHEIERIIDSLSPHPRKDSIKQDKCTWCGKEATQFRDDLSKKEYTISRLCQQCQDKTFGI